MIWKHEHLKTEFRKLRSDVQTMMRAQDRFIKRRGWPEMVITCVYRSDSLDGHDEYRAYDVRSRNPATGKDIYTAEQQWAIFEFTRKHYGRRDVFKTKYAGLQKLPFTFHAEGTASHFHIAGEER